MKILTVAETNQLASLIRNLIQWRNKDMEAKAEAQLLFERLSPDLLVLALLTIDYPNKEINDYLKKTVHPCSAEAGLTGGQKKRLTREFQQLSLKIEKYLFLLKV